MRVGRGYDLKHTPPCCEASLFTPVNRGHGRPRSSRYSWVVAKRLPTAEHLSIRPTGGRTWWAHPEFTRMNIELTILPKKFEDLREARATLVNAAASHVTNHGNSPSLGGLVCACIYPEWHRKFHLR